MINITDWVAVIPPEDKTIAYVGEHCTQRRHFFLPDLQYAEYAFYLDMAFDPSTVTSTTTPKYIESTQQTTTEVVDADGISVTATDSVNKESYTQTSTVVDSDALTDVASLWKLVREDGIEIVWTVLAQQTQLPGHLRAVLRAVGPNDEVKKSAIMNFIVAPSIEALPAATVPLTEHEQMEQAMVLALEQAAEDTYAAFDEKFEEALGSLEEVKALINEKTSPATEETYGTVMVYTDVSNARVDTGIVHTNTSPLRIVPANELAIDGRVNEVAPIVPANLEYAVKSVGDGYYATQEDMVQVVSTANAYADEKTSPATEETYGTVMVYTDVSNALVDTGIVHTNTSPLRIVPANELAIDGRVNEVAPIVPSNLDYAVKSVGDGYYALAEDVQKQKVYEHIATIKVATDEDGSLPQYVTFSADSDGNAFELTDFYVHAHAGQTDGTTSTLYMNVNGITVLANASVGFQSASLRSSTVAFRHDESDGFLTILATESMLANGVWNSQSNVKKQVAIPPSDAEPFSPVTKVGLYTLLGTNKTWVEGSTFELWGVRK